MKFKYHWGWGAGIAYTIFAGAFITILILSQKWQVDLEDKDYYQKELNYQNQINKIERTKSLPEQITFQFLNDNLTIKFPSIFKGKQISGKIIFNRPSDSKLDFENEIKLNENIEMIFPTRIIPKGLWKLKINFTVDGIEYYHEEAIKV